MYSTRRLAAWLIPFAITLLDGSVRADDVRVMIVAGQNNHDWRRSTPYLHHMIHAHEGITATIHNAPSNNNAEAWEKWNPRFSDFDVVVLNYNGQMWPGYVKERFDRYIRGGGAAMLIHAANNAFTGWKDYERMVGLLWRGRDYGSSIYLSDGGRQVLVSPGMGRNMGHGGVFDWVMTTRDREHPITKGMPLNWMHARDELYHGQRGPAVNVRVLLSAYSDSKQGGTGKHEPIVWWVPHGNGKVLTNVMGHVGDLQCLQCVGFQTITRRACLWLAGKEIDTPIPTNFPTSNQISVLEISDEMLRTIEQAQIRQVSEPIMPREQGRHGLRNGLQYRVYEGTWDRIPNFSKHDASFRGTTSSISAKPVESLMDHYGLNFRGFIAVENAGDYTFYTKSDDGSELLLDGIIVVSNDGVHGSNEEAGRVTLRAGVYPLEVRYFEKDGGEELDVFWKGPGIDKQILPTDVLLHD